MSNAPTRRLALAIETAESFADHSKVVAVLDDDAFGLLARTRKVRTALLRAPSCRITPHEQAHGAVVPIGVPFFIDRGWPVVRRSEWDAAHNPEEDK